MNKMEFLIYSFNFSQNYENNDEFFIMNFHKVFKQLWNQFKLTHFG